MNSQHHDSVDGLNVSVFTPRNRWSSATAEQTRRAGGQFLSQVFALARMMEADGAEGGSTDGASARAGLEVLGMDENRAS